MAAASAQRTADAPRGLARLPLHPQKPQDPAGGRRILGLLRFSFGFNSIVHTARSRHETDQGHRQLCRAHRVVGIRPGRTLHTLGHSIANLSLQTKRYGARQEDGSWLYETDGIDVEAIDKLAETVTANLQRGSRVRVTGSLRTDAWQDREGNPRKRLFVRADDVLFLDALASLDDAVVAEASQ